MWKVELDHRGMMVSTDGRFDVFGSATGRGLVAIDWDYGRTYCYPGLREVCLWCEEQARRYPSPLTTTDGAD